MGIANDGEQGKTKIEEGSVTVQGGKERMRVTGNLIGWFALVTSNLVSVERGRRLEKPLTQFSVGDGI